MNSGARHDDSLSCSSTKLVRRTAKWRLRRGDETGTRRVTTLLRPALLLSMGLFAGELPAQESLLEPGRLPRSGRSLDAFVPRGWTVEARADGDLTDDAIADIAAILAQSTPDRDADEAVRTLLILVGEPNGTWTSGGVDGGLFVCVGCGGVKESVGIEIARGVLLVHQLTGSRQYTDETWRFRHDPKLRRFLLIGRDVTNADGFVGGQRDSENFLTGIKISERFRYAPKSDKEITVSSKKDRIARQARFLEEVGME